MRDVLKSYLNRLVNLSVTNRSLLLRRLTQDQFIDIHSFNFAQNQPSFSIIKDLIARKQNVTLCQMADSRDEDVNLLSRRLKRLHRIEDYLHEEHGSKDLYVGWPFVRGKFSDGTHVRCPLIFFPVELLSEKNEWRLTQREDVNITLNKSFLLAYGHYNQQVIPDELLERVLDEFDTDSLVFRTGLYTLFKESPVELNFNQDNFIDQLISFQSFNKQTFDDEHKTGELKLYPEAVLGIFPQGGSYLIPDYERLIENDEFSDIVAFFEERTTSDEPRGPYDYLTKVKENETFLPFKVDAYQENAIKAVKSGNSLVVHGPPGTGKSQLICNLMADYMARGKKVLLVCQKRAALDVVYQRFRELSLTTFLALVHDFKNDRKELYEKIAYQIDHIDEYRLAINSLDALQLERHFGQYSWKIDQLTEELEEFKSALFDESECGVSVKELYLTSSMKETAVAVKQEYRYFQFNNLHEVISRIKRYGQYASKFHVDDYPLLERKSFVNASITMLRTMQEILSDIGALRETIAKETINILGKSIEMEDCLAILDKREQLKTLLTSLRIPAVYEVFRTLADYDLSEQDLIWLSNHERILIESFNNEGIEKSVPKNQLGSFQEAIQSAIRARRNLLKFIKWILFSRERKVVQQVLGANELPSSRKGLKILIKRVDNRLNLEHNLTLLNDKRWGPPFTGNLDKGQVQNWFHGLKESLRSRLIFNSVRELKEAMLVKSLSYEEFRSKLEEFFASVSAIPEHWERWSLYFTTTQLRKLTTDAEWTGVFAQVLNRDFESLCDFDNLQSEMTSYEKSIANKILDKMKNFEADHMVQIFQNSLRLQWIEHIETKYPVLRTVSSMKFKQIEGELQENVRSKLKISNEILSLRVKERTYENVEYNRLNNMVTYRDLLHQVTKQRRIWPLRKVIAHFSDELFDLMPCWMASPETVSGIFPMEQLFDLVIFDEASQCFTERGIPAMYRGKQLVIAGDEKQLRPNDLYLIRTEEESEEVALEVDSILELAVRYLKNVRLLEHYRSKKLELIDFSNRMFYNSQLKMLPDRVSLNDPSAAIDFIKVDGVWKSNTNLQEAQVICGIVFDFLDKDSTKEIGIVTFNAKQQDLILDVLEEESIKRNFILPASLIVKNIENIQGDEKDVILFSTAYAPDEKGKLIMQFGSLNMVNGENRLNVAITRAREKVVVITSILPQQLKVDNSKNLGPKMLKEYLIYALDVSEGKYRPEPLKRHQRNASWYLKDRLIKWAEANKVVIGKLSEELPFMDLTIKNDGEYVGLLATDDELYFQSPSIKDAHVYTPFTLSLKHWRYRGVFSREYWSCQEEIESQLTRFINHSTS